MALIPHEAPPTMPPQNPVVPAVFLDKDGTLIENLPYNVDPAKIRLTSNAERGLQRLGRLGVPLIVVSNQPGIALGYFAADALLAVQARLAELFTENGATLTGFYYCPHHPRGKISRYGCECLCRKPMPGLLQRAAREHQIDLSRSWLVGDILDDIEAGRRAGCRTILIDNGNETQWELGPIVGHLRTPHRIAADLDVAARTIVLTTFLPPGARQSLQLRGLA